MPESSRYFRISSFKGVFALVLWVFITLYSCFKAEINERDHPFIITLEITGIDETGATAKAEILNLGTEDILDHGFYFGTENSYDTALAFIVSLGNKAKPGVFKARIDRHHYPGLNVFVYPYVKTNKKIVFGEIISFLSEGSLSWSKIADFPGAARSYPTAFSFETDGYVGIGSGSLYLKDFWKYNSLDDSWHQTTSYYTECGLASGFVIGSKAYVGTGRNASQIFDSFFEFNPQNSQWAIKQPYSQPTSFTVENWATVGFAINGIGYIGTGSPRGNWFASYNPIHDEWYGTPFLPGLDRYAAIGVAVGNSGYVGTGYSMSVSKPLSDFWEFSQITNTWNKKADFPGGGVYGAIAFVINNKIYVGLGNNQTGSEKSRIIWEYDPATDVWREISLFPGTWRFGATVFVINDKAYIGLGRGNQNYLKDFWVFDPALM
jgi:N-acetylneuraminic acid mutarotase